jgi:transposase InsO family protein
MLSFTGVCVPSTHPEASGAEFDDGHLWHARLCHPSAEVLAQLKRRGLIPTSKHTGPQNISECAPCASGKQKRVTRLPSDHATQPGMRLHTDLTFFGEGERGETTLLTVLDDYSRFAWVFPLRSKSDSATVLQHLLALLIGKRHRPQFLHSDRGGEFMSTEFRDWLKRHGISQELAPAGTPQSNGAIERFHGTLAPRLRAVMTAKCLPRKMWPDIVVGVAGPGEGAIRLYTYATPTSMSGHIFLGKHFAVITARSLDASVP